MCSSGGSPQIPHIVSEEDFDPSNTDHMRAFEEEMVDRVKKAVSHQKRMQHSRAVDPPKTKLSVRELELAAHGLNIKDLREAQAVGIGKTNL